MSLPGAGIAGRRGSRIQSYVLWLQRRASYHGAIVGGFDKAVASNDAEPGTGSDLHGRPTDCHVRVKSRQRIHVGEIAILCKSLRCQPLL